MKKNYLFILLLCLPMIGFLPACGGDDDDVPEVNLTASPTSLQLLSDKGSSVSFSISTNSEWTISGCPEWLSLSAMAGSMNGSVTVTALSSNSSASERTAELTITAGEKFTTVSVKQLASLVSDCSVGFKDILVMTNSVAFKYDIQDKVSYFYAGYLDSSAAGWTDEKIVNTLENEDRFDPNSSQDTGLNGFAGMEPDREYYLCAVGFTEKGEQGELTKTLVRTLKSESQVPLISISDAKYSSTKWFWTTEPNSYTAKYYMLFTDGVYADYYWSFMTTAEVAWIIKDGISNGKFNPIAKGGEWNGAREPDATSLYVATWGVNAENTFSPLLNEYRATIGEDKKIRRTGKSEPEKRRRGIADEFVRTLQENTKLIVKQ